MYNTILYVVVIMAVIYGAFFYITYQRRRKLLNVMEHLDMDEEARQAPSYKDRLLETDFAFVKKQLGDQPADAFTYANTQYTGKDQAKDIAKDTLKGLATLGTVKFRTVQTPKYLVLSGGALHLMDTDSDGDISKHIVFEPFRLQQARIEEKPLSGMAKAQAKFGKFDLKLYKLYLPTEDGEVIMDIYNMLLFNFAHSGANALTMSPHKQVENIVVANHFLYVLGQKYPHLRVPTAIPFKA
ncbi:hypothetical protein D3C71_187060 [compost metagenome]